MSKYLYWILGALIFFGCTTTEVITEYKTVENERPLPHPIEYPDRYVRALDKATRTVEGAPGVNYWQQYAEYDIEARLIPDEKKLQGSVQITYHNNSPDTLFTLHLDLLQNHHAKGVERNIPAEVTGGITINSVELNGNIIPGDRNSGERYIVNGTRLELRTGRALGPGEQAQIAIDYEFKIPQAGIGGRMGYSRDNLFYLGYWYPQMTVYDDVVGWHPDQYLGIAEFYHGFAEYNLSIEVPEQWIVMATGDFLNPSEVLQSEIYERMNIAHKSDDVHNIVSPDDFGNVTQAAEDGFLTWKFNATDVRDVAFSATKESIWDGARTTVGDLNGDGELDYTMINTFYREEAPLWTEVTEYQQHAITFLSEMTGFAYPWPHMTAVEGADIIGGGMEFPMMTVMGDYNNRGARSLYGVTAHELAHMWIPLIVSTDERRYSWLDEGNTSFSTNEALAEFFPGMDSHANSRRNYVGFALTGREGEMMRHSNYHYSSNAFAIASYAKPAAILQALRGVLGEEIFWKAYRTFINEWAFKHAYPWDMFAVFERESGMDLSWFWSSWYYETWTMDQAIADVQENEEESIIIIHDRGNAIMPVHLTIRLDDGNELFEKFPVDTWLEGKRTLELTFPYTNIERVEIDADRYFPDINRRNNTWVRPEENN